MESKIGIIGGSGLYNIDGLSKIKKVNVTTPFGKPSDTLVQGDIHGHTVYFLPRHGANHTILPSELNFKANIYAFKKLGVGTILSVSAVGSLKKKYKPRDIVLVDQFYDRTDGRNSTFFGNGIVAHISFSHPICPQLHSLVYKSCKKLKLKAHKSGTYINMEGPAFSTYAESMTYRKLGFDIIGMTNLQEAKLAREAEICYVSISMVTDYDCWHTEEEIVSVDAIIENLNKNAENAKRILLETIKSLPIKDTCVCKNALQHAIMTPMKFVPAATKKKLGPIIKKYLT
ncbi:MAG: S-methyl-5'-thioadenosine phosphorylase [Candidatus Ancaeobacter aquaticus]|nr:S-methyl-5'-thioadenosine phosphorylase [Candidatus Ancaeobacter aquaticus]